MAIYIKPSKRGTLRKALNTPKGQNIPEKDLSDKPGDSKAMKKKKLFARNSKSWNKKSGGIISKLQRGGRARNWINKTLKREVTRYPEDEYDKYLDAVGDSRKEIITPRKGVVKTTDAYGNLTKTKIKGKNLTKEDLKEAELQGESKGERLAGRGDDRSVKNIVGSEYPLKYKQVKKKKGWLGKRKTTDITKIKNRIIKTKSKVKVKGEEGLKTKTRREYQRGGVAQGKSPGVDTPTTIDGTTYYQEGGTVKKFLEGKDEKDDKNISFPYKEKDKGSLISPTIEKEYKVKSWKPTKPTSPKPYEPESNLDKISEDLKKANAQRQAIGTADDIKARKLKREQDKLKQEAKFKKGGKMKYKKGGIVSKLQRGGKGQWDTNTGNPVTDYINTYAQSPEQADLDAFKKERGGYNFGKKHDRLRSRAQNIQSKRENVYSSAKDRSDVNIKKDDRRAARQVRLRDKARGIRSESYGLQKGGIIGKIKKKLKEKKGNWKDVGGKAINTKTPELSPVSTAKDKIKEDLKKGNRY